MAFGDFAAQVRDRPDWDAYEVARGHDVMLDAPDRLTQILQELA